MRSYIYTVIALVGLICSAQSQTIKSLGYDTTNGNVVYSGTNPLTFTNPISVKSLTTTDPSGWVLDATQTAAATNGILALPDNANVIRLTNNNAISGISNGRLGAFYYVVNQATNSVTISNAGNLTVQGGRNLTLAPNQAATLVATGATNASVAARGDLTDVVLGGTANTAPSQTASSGSSLMTRDLVDNAAAYDASFGPTYAAYSQTTNSATAVARLVAGLGVQTGSATNGRSCVALGENFWNNASFSGAVLPSTKAIDFYLHGVTIASPANTNWVARVIFGQGQPGTRIPPAAGEDAVTSRSWGVEFYNNGTNNVSRLFWHNGTNLFKASEQVLAGSGSAYIAAFKFSQDGDGGISFTESTSSAGRIPNTPTFSTNVVFGGSYFGRYILIEAAGNTNQAQPGSGAGILTRAQYIRYVP